MTATVEGVTADLRSRLAIPSARLDDLNALLLDPGSRVVNDILAVIARYGTPEEINQKARAAGELPALLARVRATHPAYLADLEWLAGERDRGAFVGVADFRRGVLGERAEHCIIMSLGSGPDAHGQLLIYHDAFALYPKFTPRMAKVFADAGAVIREGLAAYVDEVTGRTFPQPENWFGMKDEEYDELVRLLA
jgi:hypothetical protein